MAIATVIRKYVLENYLFTDNEDELKNDDSFLEKGILDSTGILEIITLIEEQFGIKVDDAEMIPENLDSVNNIVSYVTKKQKM
jgi:acyl carrier protein